MTIISGTDVARSIKSELKEKISDKKLDLTLAVVLVGENPASEKYVSMKEKAAIEVGIKFRLFKKNADIDEDELTSLINEINNDDSITGMIVQLPLPDHLNSVNILEHIRPEKDVDGLTSTNMGKLVKNLPCLRPATPEGVIELLKHYNVEISGKKAVVVGRSDLVGKPLSLLLLNNDATVTTAHAKTQNLLAETKEADIIISAVGKPGLITRDHVKAGAVIIDVGTTKIDDSGLKGDVDFENVSEIASYITPVPGGVGPMTVTMLLSNVVKAHELNN